VFKISNFLKTFVQGFLNTKHPLGGCWFGIYHWYISNSSLFKIFGIIRKFIVFKLANKLLIMSVLPANILVVYLNLKDPKPVELFR